MRLDLGKRGPTPITEIEIPDALRHRVRSGLSLWDEVLGDGTDIMGMVPGSVILVTGNPGAGKSTVLTQVLAAMQLRGHQTMVFSGEEHSAQFKLRQERLGLGHVPILFSSTMELDTMMSEIENHDPEVFMVDSVQCMYLGEVGKRQMQAAADRLVSAAKQAFETGRMGPIIFLICHVTKSGEFLGPAGLKYAVDGHLKILRPKRAKAGERILVMDKYRFGADQIEHHTKMTGSGLDLGIVDLDIETDPETIRLLETGDPLDVSLCAMM